MIDLAAFLELIKTGGAVAAILVLVIGWRLDRRILRIEAFLWPPSQRPPPSKPQECKTHGQAETARP